MIDRLNRTIRRSCRRLIPTARSRADLAGALDHGQRERVHDAEGSDDDRQRQQARDEQEPVDLNAVLVHEFLRGPATVRLG